MTASPTTPATVTATETNTVTETVTGQPTLPAGTQVTFNDAAGGSVDTILVVDSEGNVGITSISVTP